MIELQDITKTYPDGFAALSGVSLSLDRGMFGLLGHNGAGKTTFLSILVLALEPTFGRRVYDGLDAARPTARAAIRSRIGFLPQDYQPIRHQTGREYLLHCARGSWADGWRRSSKRWGCRRRPTGGPGSTRGG
jgi:ABC-type multidrug transport system ATPase subunit